MAIDHVVDESAHDIDEPVNAADGVIRVSLVHVGHSHQSGEDFVIPEARVQVHVIVFDVATCQVDGATLRSDGSRVQRHFKLHRDLFLLEDASFDPEELTAPLVPLETVQSLGQLASKRGLDVVIDSQIFLN